MRTIFFDFDGTLADTSAGIINGYNYAFDKKGLPRPPEETIRENIGPTLKNALINLAPGGSEEVISELATLYREYYSTEGLYELDFFKGIHDMLEYLYQKNVQLRIISSKPTVFIEKILERYGYGGHFSRIDGASLGHGKTKKERLKESIVNEGMDPAMCIVVGDRAEDMDAALFCGMNFIGVLFGFGDKGELKGSTTVSSVKGLKKMLTERIEI